MIVDPERIGHCASQNLYVSMTRATQRLGLLHVEALAGPARPAA